MKRTSASAAILPETSTREAILDAAERRFADRGFEGTSMRDIAADVSLKNQASLYHYFRSKQQLYEAVLRRGVDALVPLWQDGSTSISDSADADRAAVLGANLGRVLDHLTAHPHIARLIERAGLEDDRYVRGAMARLLRPLYAAGVRALEDAGGPWQPSELPHLAAGLYHLIFGYYANTALLQAVMREDPQSAEMLARQRRFLTTAIARLLGDDERNFTPRIIT